MHFDPKAFLLRKTRAKATSGDRMLFKMVFFLRRTSPAAGRSRCSDVRECRSRSSNAPLAHPLLPLYSHQSLSTFFAKCQTLSFWAFCFCDKNPRQNLARNISASPSPVARVCQPAFRGWPPKGLKILPDGVPSAFPTFLERDEAAVHQTELGSLQEAGLVLA